jgi:Tol biopolymer transport system component
MPLSPGSKLGSYEVIAALGAGGMGEVYRARDTRLGRDVAIKVLPADRLADENRRRRFVQEARAASALNHPNIVTIYEIESADGIDFIVMEYVPGKTLAQRIVAPMRVEDVLKLATPIADALASAHAVGIVHRDLKPANIVVSNDGVVKLLDFGLAKLVIDSGSNPEGETAPTASQPLSRPGVVAGTPGYMSPEQATGARVDARSDVFAFGAVLYEMITARRVFARSSTAETLAALLREVPTPPSELVAHVPRQLEKLIQRCLAKDPARRSQHMADVKVELQEIGDELGSPVAADAPPRKTWAVAAALAAAALSVGVGLELALRKAANEPSGPVTRFSIPLPEGTRLAQTVPSVAISRDSSRVVLAAQRGRIQELYLRELAGSEWKRLPATEEAGSPFFSPDGKWVGFFTPSRLNRVAFEGGTPQTVCGVRAYQRANDATAVWGEDGWITYAGWPASGLWRCPAAGGPTEKLDGAEPVAPRPVMYGGPKWLSGGTALLFGTWTAGSARIEALSMTTARRRVVVEMGTSPSYAATGHLLHGWDNQILAASFNADTLDTRTAPIAVVQGVRMGGIPAPRADYALSENGTLVYVPGKKPERRLVRVDRTGQIEPVPLPAGDYIFPTLSPDGDRVAFGMFRGTGRDIWIGDLGRGSVSRLTSDEDSVFSLWSPDGRDVVYTSSQSGQYNLFKKAVDGNAAPTRLTDSLHAQRATSWSQDGRLLLFNDTDPETRVDVWVLSLDGARTPSPLLKTAARELSAAFSPDGKWIAYQSDESGRFEVYVQSFPGPGERRQASNDGGVQPSWNTNGRELFYTADDRVLSVSFDARQGLRLGRPELLFRADFAASLRPFAEYSVTPDGRGFLFLEDAAPTAPAQLEVVVNWFQELKQRVPVVR